MDSKSLYVIVGGNTYIGREVVRQLVLGNCRVRILDDIRTIDMFGKATEFASGKVTDVETLVAGFTDASVVIHLRFNESLVASVEDLTAVNVVGTQNVVRACQACGVRKLVMASTPQVVMTTKGIENGKEDLPYSANPLDNYAASMIAAEKFVLASNGVDGLLTCVLRCSMVFSPLDGRMFRDLRMAAYDDELTTVVGTGTGTGVFHSLFFSRLFNP